MDWRTTLERICGDRRTGATGLTVKAVRLLVRMVKGGADPEAFKDAAQRIADAHPAMAPLWHLARLTRRFAHDPDKFTAVLSQFLADLNTHGDAAIAHAAKWLPEGTIFTHSFSSLVHQTFLTAFRGGKRFKVVCTASYPGGEGIALAGGLQREGIPVLLVPDLQAFEWLPRCDVFFIGADALCRDGLVHKVGTKALAEFASRAGVPLWVIATSEKRLPLHWRPRMTGQASPLTKASIPQDTTLYDLTGWAFIAGLVTEKGVEIKEPF